MGKIVDECMIPSSRAASKLSLDGVFLTNCEAVPLDTQSTTCPQCPKLVFSTKGSLRDYLHR